MGLLLEYTFSWEAFGWGTALLLFAGGLMVSDEFRRYKYARICFSLAAFWTCGKVLMYSVNTLDNFWVRTTAIFVVFGLVGTGLSEGMRLISHREKKENEAQHPPLRPEKPGTVEILPPTDAEVHVTVKQAPSQTVETKVEHPEPSADAQDILAKQMLENRELKKRLIKLSTDIYKFWEERKSTEPRAEDYFKTINIDQQKEPQLWQAEREQQQKEWGTARSAYDNETVRLYTERFKARILHILPEASAAGLSTRQVERWMRDADAHADILNNLSQALADLGDKL
jgi:hypothetical protein